jgi:hypothetical protein
MIMKPNLDADKISNPKSRLNLKKLGYFKASAGFHVTQTWPLIPVAPNPYNLRAFLKLHLGSSQHGRFRR